MLLERQGFFSLFERYQGCFPASLQFCGHQTVVWIHLVVLMFSQVGLILPITFTATDSTGLSNVIVTNLQVQSVLRGDVDGNNMYTLNDVVVLASHIFRGGQAPNPMDAGDADFSGTVDVSDIVYMINFLYHAGPRPPQ